MDIPLLILGIITSIVILKVCLVATSENKHYHITDEYIDKITRK